MSKGFEFRQKIVWVEIKDNSHFAKCAKWLLSSRESSFFNSLERDCPPQLFGYDQKNAAAIVKTDASTITTELIVAKFL